MSTREVTESSVPFFEDPNFEYSNDRYHRWGNICTIDSLVTDRDWVNSRLMISFDEPLINDTKFRVFQDKSSDLSGAVHYDNEIFIVPSGSTKYEYDFIYKEF